MSMVARRLTIIPVCGFVGEGFFQALECVDCGTLAFEPAAARGTSSRPLLL